MAKVTKSGIKAETAEEWGKDFGALTVEEIAELMAWANEGDRPGGCTAWGPYFDGAMKVARRVRDTMLEKMKEEGVE